MNQQDVVALVNHADPVPDPENLPDPAWSEAELLRAINERRGQMQELIEDTELQRNSGGRGPMRRRWVAAGAAFVAVIATVGTVAWLANSDLIEDVAETTTLAPTTTASPPTTASAPTTSAPLGIGPFELTAEQEANVARYVDAQYGANWDEYLALFATGTKLERSTDITPSWSNTTEEDTRIFVFLDATGFRTELERCQQFPPRVVCSFLNYEAASLAFNLGPWREVISFEYDDAGLITYFSADMSQYPFSAFGQFADWVNETHPEQSHLVVVQEWNYGADPAEALALLDEYAAYLDNQ